VDAKAELPPARGMNARSGERMCEFAQRERICLAEVVHARPFVLAAGTLRARIPKNRYPQLDRIAVADGLRLSLGVEMQTSVISVLEPALPRSHMGYGSSSSHHLSVPSRLCTYTSHVTSRDGGA
jgi:hypothetical protein